MVRYNFQHGLRDRDHDFNLLDSRLGRERCSGKCSVVVLTPHSLYVVIDRLSSCIVGMNGGSGVKCKSRLNECMDGWSESANEAMGKGGH